MEPTPDDKDIGKPVVVKKYANRRLYNTETSSYITLDTLCEMVRGGRDFAVFDAKTGEDITRSVLTQIIVEEESKGRAMLPVSFTRHLISFYSDALPPALPSFLEQAAGYFAGQREQMRSAVEKTIGGFLPPAIEEMSRQSIASNMAIMERTMALFAPFYRDAGRDAGAEKKPGSDQATEIAALRDQVRRLEAELAVRKAPGQDQPEARAPTSAGRTTGSGG